MLYESCLFSSNFIIKVWTHKRKVLCKLIRVHIGKCRHKSNINTCFCSFLFSKNVNVVCTKQKILIKMQEIFKSVESNTKKNKIQKKLENVEMLIFSWHKNNEESGSGEKEYHKRIEDCLNGK